ncbi:hypothetical protein Q31b_02320 [Novipirellula aureliae]|uniref:Uncharacterized protein n=1 Tax=Novipirellula aureliae TaxID=2527966 RepID=A0A5C6EBC4_9BACT|nr:hypothetical protein Q31b_02320 [Novipirellula aureliae]
MQVALLKLQLAMTLSRSRFGAPLLGINKPNSYRYFRLYLLQRPLLSEADFLG